MLPLRFTALDTETTGLRSDTDSIIEVGFVRFDLSGHSETFTSYCHPGTRIPAITTRITGITDADIADAPPISALLPTIQDFITDTILIGHNLTFDLEFLTKAGLDTSSFPRYDTFDLAGLFLPKVKSRNLSALLFELGVDFRDGHRALPDAEATRALFLALLSRARAFPDHLLAQLATNPLLAPLITAVQHVPPHPTPPPPTPQRLPAADPALSTLLSTDTVLIESPHTANTTLGTLSSLGTPALLSVANPYQALTLSTLFGIPAQFAPSEYSDPAKTASLLATTQNPALAYLAGKCTLFPAAPKHQLNIDRTEHLLFPLLAADAPKSPTQSPLLITCHSSLSSVAAQYPSHHPVLISALQYKERITETGDIRADLAMLEKILPHSTSTLTVLFGLAGILYGALSPQYATAPFHAGIHKPSYHAIQRILKDLLTLPDLPPPLSTLFSAFLTEDSPLSPTLIGAQDGTLSFAITAPRTPLPAGTLPHTTTYLDTALFAGDSGAYAKRLLALPADATTAQLPFPAPALLTDYSLPAPADPGFQKALFTWLITTLPTFSGITAVLFTSKIQAGDFLEYASRHLPALPLLAEHASGSRGNIEHQLMRLPTAVYLGSTGSSFLPPRTERLIITRLPFTVTEGSDFMADTLPETILTLRRAASLMHAVSGHPGTLLLTDSRLDSKPYGKNILAALSDTPPIPYTTHYAT